MKLWPLGSNDHNLTTILSLRGGIIQGNNSLALKTGEILFAFVFVCRTHPLTLADMNGLLYPSGEADIISAILANFSHLDIEIVNC